MNSAHKTYLWDGCEIMCTITRNCAPQTLNSQPNFHTCRTTVILGRTRTKKIVEWGNLKISSCWLQDFINLLPWDLWMWDRYYGRRLNGSLFLFVIEGIESRIFGPARLLQWKLNENKNKYYAWMSIIVQQDATMYSLLYFCKLLYMFRVVYQPIIRSKYN